MRGIVALGFLAGAAAWCQSVTGSAAGQPLAVPPPLRAAVVGKFWVQHGRAPAGEQEIQEAMARQQCDDLRGQIMAAEVKFQKARFGISASAEEGAALSKIYWNLHDPEAEASKIRADARVLGAALAQVYDQGRSAEPIYRDLIAPTGMPQAIWQSNLELGRNAEFRAKLGRVAANTTAQAVMKGTDKTNVALVERRRLDDAVDRELTAQDPEFGRYLDVLHRTTRVINPFESQGSGMPPDQMIYIQRKRAEWWQARYAETKVVVNDPTLRDRCRLDALQ